MGRPGNDDVDKLLAAGRLGGPARERILERVLRDVDPAAPRSRRWRWSRAIAALLAASSVAAGVALFTRVAPRPSQSDGLRAKGPAPAAAPAISLLCSDGEGICRTGERLFFRIGPTPRRRWLVAYAERADQPGAPRIWLSPGEAGRGDSVLEVPASDAPSVLRRAVEIGAAMPPGRYAVTMSLFDHAPTPTELHEAPVGRARLTAPLVIR
jgi:hypothetical protein